jgi:hypothetical protein
MTLEHSDRQSLMLHLESALAHLQFARSPAYLAIRETIGRTVVRCSQTDLSLEDALAEIPGLQHYADKISVCGARIALLQAADMLLGLAWRAQSALATTPPCKRDPRALKEERE